MLDHDTLREIQRLMNESRGDMCDPGLNKRRIAALLGIDYPGQPAPLPSQSGDAAQVEQNPKITNPEK